MRSFLYENTVSEEEGNYIQIKLKGQKINTQAIGAKLTVYACGQTLMNEQFPSRGFQSSIANYIHVGLGKCSQIDSLVINWPDGLSQLVLNPEINQLHKIDRKEDEILKEKKNVQVLENTTFKKIKPLGITHKEFNFNQFNRERLLFKMNTNQGPAIATADLNSDGQQDIFIGGAKNQTSTLLLSNNNSYDTIRVPFEKQVRSEVVDAIFFDSDNDGDIDLYIAHGGTAFPPRSAELKDLIYLNDGKGNLMISPKRLPFPTSIATGALAITDFDQDGLLDIFVGNRNSNNLYGKPGSGYLLKNKGANEYELLDLPDLENLGMITDAGWLDINEDGRSDLVVVGEWMPICIFINDGKGLKKSEEKLGLEHTNGMWNCLLLEDFNKDGKIDIFAGNIGQNSILSKQHKLFINDFDSNGQIEQILCEAIEDKDFPILDMDEIMGQLPSLKRKYLYYRDYSGAAMSDLFSKELLNNAMVLELDMVESALWWQTKNGFEKQSLPLEVQYSSVHTSFAKDYNQDGNLDIFLGGNHFLVKPQFGRQDASKGWLLTGQTTQDKSVTYPFAQSLYLDGQIRNFTLLDDKRTLIGINNQPILVVE